MGLSAHMDLYLYDNMLPNDTDDEPQNEFCTGVLPIKDS